MLHEASSIVKAIEKAWTESGNPSEFTIKVLESGEKGILWFSKKPAIVSITYDPKRQTVFKSAPTASKNASIEKKQTPPINKQPWPARPQQPARGQRDFAEKPQAHMLKQPKQHFKAQVNTQEKIQTPNTPEALGWTPEFITHILASLKELTGILNIDTPPTTRVENKTLFISFPKKILHSADEEKMLFISISYLLMQFLKKKCKKKLKNFHLVLTTKDLSPHDKNQSGSTER